MKDGHKRVLEACSLGVSYATVLGAVVGWVAALALLPSRRWALSFVVGVVVLLLGVMVRGALEMWLDRIDETRVRRRDSCSKCGYDLRGLSRHARCPECGGGRSWW
jgi:tRNA(Ile2) C34 agmatinyltransferase TiaS